MQIIKIDDSSFRLNHLAAPARIIQYDEHWYTVTVDQNGTHVARDFGDCAVMFEGTETIGNVAAELERRFRRPARAIKSMARTAVVNKARIEAGLKEVATGCRRITPARARRAVSSLLNDRLFLWEHKDKTYELRSANKDKIVITVDGDYDHPLTFDSDVSFGTVHLAFQSNKGYKARIRELNNLRKAQRKAASKKYKKWVAETKDAGIIQHRWETLSEDFGEY